MYDYLNDINFLKELENSPIKNQYVKIIILDFKEQPIREIQGIVQDGGNINVNGSSSLRRTTSFTMFADATTNNLTNIDNLISLNKKIKILIGYENNIQGYEHYGDIIWFKGGTYVVMQASLSNTTTGSTISIQGRDKMVFLNGQVGGIIPSQVILHERQEVMPDGSKSTTYVKLYQIIRELVSEYGGEDLNNIVISDLPLTTKQLIKYIGDENLHISKDKVAIMENSLTNAQQNRENPNDNGGWTTYINSQDVGYQETDFTYPGELKFNAGTPVTQVLDQICQVLGNFEYFYDLDGKFVFQEKKNYLNTAYTPISTLEGKEYINYFSNDKYYYSFKNMEQVVSITSNPKYENIKNDFILWGKKSDNTPILYHLAIDAKPQIEKANKYMWEVRYEDNYFIRYEYSDEETTHDPSLADINTYYTYELAKLYEKYFLDVILVDEAKYQELGGTEEALFNYFFELAQLANPEEDEYYSFILNSNNLRLEDFREELDKLQGEWSYAVSERTLPENRGLTYTLIGKPCLDWREELYRQALERSAYGLPAEYYDAELLAFWRTLYNPIPQITNIESYETIDWYDKNSKQAWNPSVFINPSSLVFWIDFLDDDEQLRQYGISSIGRRTKVQNADKVNNIFNSEIPDLLFVENNFSTINDKNKKIEELRGQNHIFYETSQSSIFAISSTGMSAFETIRDMLYQNFTYNTQINIVCVPKYYLEPNKLIYIADTNNGVSGDYVITQFSLPLNYKGTMNITAAEALTRI